MDLSQLSTEDLIAMRGGDLSKVSVDGLKAMQGMAAARDPMAIKAAQQKQNANTYAGEDVGTMGTIMRGLGGAKHAWDKAAMGLKGLVTDLTPEDQALLQQGEAFLNEGGTAAKVGQIGADVAMTAAPVARGMQVANAGIRMLPKAAQFIGKGGIAPAAVAGGAVSAALDPNDRAGAAMGGAAGGAIGQGVGNVLTKALGGVVSNRVTPEARQLMNQGVNVPLWKGTESKILRDVGERAKVLPVVGNIIRGQERSAFDDFNRVMAGRATPPTPVLDDAGNVLRWETGSKVSGTGSEAIDELGKRFNQSYDALYKGRGIPVDDAYGRETASILESTRNYFPRIADDVESASRQADDILRRGTESKFTQSPIVDDAGKPFVNEQMGHATTRPESVKQAIDALETRITSAYQRGDAEAAEQLKALRASIEDLRGRGLPPEVASQAGEINKAYATFKQLQRANSQLGAQTSGVTTPRQMLSAIKANDRTPGKSAFSRGSALNQADVLNAEQVLGSRLPDVGPGTAEKLLPAIGLGLPMMGYDAGLTALLGTKTGQKFLMGGLPGQAGIRQYGNQYLVPALRSFGVAEGN
jgi:hypothetical protein